MKNVFELTSNELAQIKISILNKMIENENDSKIKNPVEINAKRYTIYYKLSYLNENCNEFTDEEEQYLKDNFNVNSSSYDFNKNNSIPIGLALKIFRKNKGLKNKEMSKFMNVSTHAYIKYERNERIPRIEGLIALADYFNVSIDEILGRNKKAAVTTNNNRP